MKNQVQDCPVDDFINILRRIFRKLPERQRSEAFDSITSIRQYRKSYQWILANIKSNATALDWGCGNGHYSFFLMKYGYNVTSYGFENPEVFTILDNGFDKNYIKASDPTGLPFKDNTFDLVVSIGVLEHVREFGGNEVKSLKEIRRVLKHDGRFYCYHLPNYYSCNEFLSRQCGRWNHRYRYTRSDIANMVNEGGLKVIEMDQYGFLPRNILGTKYLNKIFDIKLVSILFEVTDNILSIVLKPFSQNWFFVASKYGDK